MKRISRASLTSCRIFMAAGQGLRGNRLKTQIRMSRFS
jgi:hypothetical protein